MIDSIRLKFGRTVSSEPVSIETTPVTVFVGPNNSGKSQILAEIFGYCSSGQKNVNDVIIDAVRFRPLGEKEIEAKIAEVTLPFLPNERLREGFIVVGKGKRRLNCGRDHLIRALQNPNANPDTFCQHYLQFNTLMLDGTNRIVMTREQVAGDLQQPAHASFQVLFGDNAKRSQVSRIIYEAFGFYLVVDPTNLGKLRLKLSSRTPADELEERGIHEAAVRFHADATPIESTSDGVKAFTGIITETIAGDPYVLLIDEPEAFLHPSLSFKLGKEMARASSGSEKRLFVSTHSSSFVMGCIQSGAPVNIVRLTYRDGMATARILPNDEILRLMRNPLLRSTGVLGGLFYEFVVVTESDADRAFYQEINERLLQYEPDLGIPNCLFINAQNKQTVQSIIKPLRELGIPAAAVVDIDILKDGGANWSNFLASGFVPQISHQPLGSQRVAIKDKLESTGKDMKRDGGVRLLDSSNREAANNLLDQMAEYGLLVVRDGELECWLKHLGATGHGPNWLVEVFEKMGEDPECTSYLRPATGDVWAFVHSIRRWLVNPHRKGIPE